MPVGDSDHVVLAPSHGVGGAGRVVEPIMVVHLGVDGSAGDEAGRPQSGMQNVRGGRRSIPPADKNKMCGEAPHSYLFPFSQSETCLSSVPEVCALPLCLRLKNSGRILTQLPPAGIRPT